MMKKSQGKERERKKTGRCRWRRWNACVYIPFFPTWTRFDLDNSFHCCGTIQTGKAEPLSLSLCLSSLLFIVHWSIIQLSRVDDRCKNDILASCALEREGEQVSLLLITPAQAKKNLFIVLGHFQKGRKWFWSTSYRCAQLPIKNLSVEPLKVSRTR